MGSSAAATAALLIALLLLQADCTFSALRYLSRPPPHTSSASSSTRTPLQPLARSTAALDPLRGSTDSLAQRLLPRLAATASCLLLLSSAPLPAHADSPTPALGECITESNPQTTVQICRQLGLVDENQRVRGCQANENCFSTSAIAGGKRVSPWFYRQPGPEAREVLTEALRLEGLKVLQNKAVGEGVYLLAAEKAVPKQPPGSSVFYEFLLKGGPPGVVLYRAGKSVSEVYVQ